MSQCNKTQMLPDIYLDLYAIQGAGLLCLDAHSPAGVSNEVWLGGWGLASVAHIAGQGRGAESSLSVQILTLRWLTAPDTVACRQAFCKYWWEKKKKKKHNTSRVQNVRDSKGRRKKKGKRLQELNEWAPTLPLNYRILQCKAALKGCKEKWKSHKVDNSASEPAEAPVQLADRWDKASMAMEQRFRNYSSDSVGSDRVFVEDSYYQGMLKAMDYRKGRVWRHYSRDYRCSVIFLRAMSLILGVTSTKSLIRGSSLLISLGFFFLQLCVMLASCWKQLSFQPRGPRVNPTGHAPPFVSAFPLLLGQSSWNPFGNAVKNQSTGLCFNINLIQGKL